MGILELEEELRVVANNLKSLEVAEEKANQREKTSRRQGRRLRLPTPPTTRLPRSLPPASLSLRRPSRRSTRPSLRSSSRPSLRCPDTRRCSSNQIRVYCIENMSGD